MRFIPEMFLRLQFGVDGSKLIPCLQRQFLPMSEHD